MADINLNFNYDDLENLKKSVDELYKAILKASAALEKKGLITEDDVIKQKLLATELLKAENALKKQLAIKEKLEQKDKAATDSITALNKKYKELQKAVQDASSADRGRLAEAAKKAKDELEKARVSTNNWGKALDSFQFKFNALGNVAANVLSKIYSAATRTIAEFISFNKVIQSTQVSSDGLARELSGLKASFNQLNIAIATGNFENFFQGLIKASKAAREYADAIDDIGDRKRQLSVAETDTLKRQAELIEIWKNPDATYSIKQQVDAVKELMSIQEELSTKTAVLSKESYEAEVKRITGATNLTEDEIMTYIKLYDQQEKLVKLGRQLAAAKDVIATSSKFEADAAREVLKGLKEEAALLGANEKAIEIYSKMVNKFSDEDRQVVVDKYKAWKEAEVAYITENKRLMGSLFTLNKQLTSEQDKAAKGKKAGILGVEQSDLDESYALMESYISDLGNLTEDFYRTNIYLEEENTKNFVKQWQKRTNAEDDELKKQSEILFRQKLEDIGIYADFFMGLKGLADENTVFFKAAAMAEATIDTYAAAISAMRYTKAGTVARFVSLAAVIAVGLANVRKIAGVSIPKKAEGGEILGKPHSQGGTLIEAERGEYVIKRSAYHKHRDLVKAINADDQIKIAMALNQDKKIEKPQHNYTKELLDYMKKQPVYGETKEYYVIHEGNRITKIHKN